ncbi:hypothetical protein, partial [Klebsiella pneumoniae]|uniref:hypothetical protein n=1 Tax=Klebsiella pneumoniae TaxID=573 RepID=UPI003854556A
LANYDPALRGVSINVLNWLDPESENFVSDADAMAASMIVRASKEAHWDDAAEDVLSWAIMHVRSTLPDGNLGDVRNFVCLPVPALLNVFE